MALVAAIRAPSVSELGALQATEKTSADFLLQSRQKEYIHTYTFLSLALQSPMFSDPLAFLITWHTYGSWLHGDRRGSIDEGHNGYGKPSIAPDMARWQRMRSRMVCPAVRLDATSRKAVRDAVLGVVHHRAWKLHAINVRTNHIHVVVTGDKTPERILNDFKVWSTRKLIETGIIVRGKKPWALHGSTRYLWSEQSVRMACRYVVEGQGRELDAPE